jgi:hypothetical protein
MSFSKAAMSEGISMPSSAKDLPIEKRKKSKIR